MTTTPTDAEVFYWIAKRYGEHMSRHLFDVHRHVLLMGDYANLLPTDLDKVLQTVQHARACIKAGHEPVKVVRP